MGAARRAWGDFSVKHQELEEMSRKNAEMLGLQVLQAKTPSRAGAVEGPSIQGEIFTTVYIVIRSRTIHWGFCILMPD